MEHQSKLDSDAAAAIAIMFLATSLLTADLLAVSVFAAGVAMMPAFFLAALRENM